jgi:hypothetical protein
MNSTNSGIQYRSKMLPPERGPADGTPVTRGASAATRWIWISDNQYPGQLYEEAGRGFLAERGTITYIRQRRNQGPDRQPRERRRAEGALQAGRMESVPPHRRGNTLIHIVNGHVTAVCVDDDVKGRSMAGLIGFQLHAGPPMKLEIRNVAIKLL